MKTFSTGPLAHAIDYGGKKAVILWDSGTGTASAYALETEGSSPRVVTLAVDPTNLQSPWVDHETGSRWSIAGRAVSGTLKGQTLRWLPGVMVKWYAWAAEYPKTSIESLKGDVKAGAEIDTALSDHARGESG